MGFRTLHWRDGALWLLDQRKLPGQVEEVRVRSASETARAIREMVVRGAPAIGCTAAYGLALAAREAAQAPDPERAFSAALAACRAIGKHGAELVPDGSGILTHCNAGGLATSGYGTALGVIRAALEAGKKCGVFANETRPWLQGARLTAWELLQDGIPVTLLPDVAAASLLGSGRIGCVVIGAERIARNGDTANKVGTYPLALAAQAAEVPFFG